MKNLSFSHSLYPDVLFEVDVPVWDPVKCHNLGNVYGKFGENICAGDKDKDSCVVNLYLREYGSSGEDVSVIVKNYYSKETVEQ